MPRRPTSFVPSLPAARRPPAARGLTLAELLLAVAIIVVLFSLLVVSARAVRNASRKAEARAQLAILATAVEHYARDWPRWEIGGTLLADRGWPHWSPWAAFPINATAFPPVYFETIAGFNDDASRRIDPSDDDTTNASGAFTGRSDVIRGNECLIAGLTSKTGESAYLPESVLGHIEVPDSAARYPRIAGGNQAQRPRRRMLDPWGNPYRYLWLIRDPNPGTSANGLQASGWRAITSSDPADPTNYASDPFFNPPPTANPGGPPIPTAAFVIESAGPDGFFGNVWKRDPTAAEVQRASDNVTIRP